MIKRNHRHHQQHKITDTAKYKKVSKFITKAETVEYDDGTFEDMICIIGEERIDLKRGCIYNWLKNQQQPPPKRIRLENELNDEDIIILNYNIDNKDNEENKSDEDVIDATYHATINF